MRKLLLICDGLDSLHELHTRMKELFGFPEYYGENFDAMFDCLTDVCEPTRLEVRDLKKSGLGAAARVFRQVVLDADESNPNFHVIFTKTAEVYQDGRQTK